MWGLLGIVVLLFFMYDNPIKAQLGRFMGVVSPFIVGIVIAYLLSRPSDIIESFFRRSNHAFIAKKARVLSVLLLYVGLITGIVMIAQFALPVIVTNIIDFSSHIYDFYLQFMDTLYYQDYPTWLESILTTETIDAIMQALSIESIIRSIGNYAPTLVLTIINLSSGIINLFISLIFSIYMLVYKKNVLGFVKRVAHVFMPEKRLSQVSMYIGKSSAIFYRFIFAQFVDACILGTLATLMLTLFGVQYAILFGVFLGFCNMIPYFGSMIGSILTTIITIFTGGPQLALLTGVGLLILQQIDGNFIGPRIMGDSLNINPMLIIVSITIGGAYFGVVGMFVSVPLSAIIKLFVDDFLDYKERNLKN
ncbi:hypothetical protein AOC36_02350 [Erysipelothrix larvae]|uniref:Permease n=2 Tax=Erysipelothrix larvae TaxID=1514105 RepID=A0A0X8H2E8_9FIRM|nr:hypothetical protein AOC36_02350 [Erysipelothrix larvae]